VLCGSGIVCFFFRFLFPLGFLGSISRPRASNHALEPNLFFFVRDIEINLVGRRLNEGLGAHGQLGCDVNLEVEEKPENFRPMEII
jgi:hypothetical protein